MIRKYLPQNTEELIHWYERYISPLSLIAGFLLDNFVLLRRVDVLSGNILLLTYLITSGAGLILLNLIESGRIRALWVLKISPFISVIVQFSFGGLFSGYLSLYSRSAGAAVSWVFVLAMAFLLLGNERFRTLYSRPVFQISMYFTVIFSFFIFFLPLMFKRIGVEMFVVSGISSIVCIALFVALMRKAVPERVNGSWVRIVRSLTTIFVVFNILYFANLIPPLPLAMKAGGVYHAIERSGDVYRLQSEQATWYARYLNYPAVFHYTAGERAYIFSAVFAPSGLSTVIRHQWQYYDATLKSWVTKSDVRFTIFGGREGGFRGYSQKSDLEIGSWRVNVLTDSGQIIGRIAFTVVDSTTTPMLIDEVQ